MKTIKNLLTIFALLFASVATTFGQITVTVNPLPTADAGADQSIALGGSTQIGTPDAGDTYSWTSDPVGFTSTDAQPTVSPIVPTTYYLYVTNGTCDAYDTVFVNVTGTALAVASKVANPGTVCSGDQSVLSIVPQGGTGTYSFSWNLVGDATVLSTNDTLIVNPTSAVDAIIRYHVLLDDGVSTVNDTLDVNVNALPTATFGADASICFGDVIDLTVNPANGLAPYSVTMDNGTGDLVAPNNINPVIGVGVGGTATFSVQPGATTTYHFTITDDRGCSITY